MNVSQCHSKGFWYLALREIVHLKQSQLLTKFPFIWLNNSKYVHHIESYFIHLKYQFLCPCTPPSGQAPSITLQPHPSKPFAKESLGPYELKQHKPWFDGECLGFFGSKEAG